MRRKKFHMRIFAATAAALLLPGAAFGFSVADFDTVTDPTAALLFSFDVIPPANSSAGDLGMLDLGLAVTVNGSQMVFEFINLSAIDSVITDIYFDDSGESLIGNGQVLSTEVANVLAFTIGAGAPPDLPGGNDIGFTGNTDLSAHADNPSPMNGVGPPEHLVLGYDALGTTGAVNDALLDGTLRVGFHLQSIGDSGSSDSFFAAAFNGPPPPPPPPPQDPPIPEPATIVLLGMGASFLVARKRFLI